MVVPRNSVTSLCAFALLCLTAWLGWFPALQAEEQAPAEKDLQSLGGRWYLQPGPPPKYWYRDGTRLVDLFSYHQQDSNNDGIPNIKLSHNEEFLLVESQGYPNHPTAIFPNSQNPNTIQVQHFKFKFPLKPRRAEEITRLPMGPIGMAMNGVVFFNPFEQEGMNAVEGYSEVWLDSCCGHPQQHGVYHYHKYPSCVKSPFVDDGKQHSPILGFAFDGYPLHGPYESADVNAKDLKGANALDACNGHEDSERGYHYHVTPGRFPYIMGGYRGVVEKSNNRGFGRAGTGVIVDNTQPGTRQEAIIVKLTPGVAARGQRHEITIELDPEQSRRQPLPTTKPSWAQIGPFEAKTIAREKNTVTLTIEIPQDAPIGVWFDCHLEFGDGARPRVVKKNDVFRVSE